MRIKKLLLTTALLMGMNTCFAVSLEDVCGQLSTHPNTTGTFVQTKTMQTAKGPKALKSTGTFILCKQGIVWKTEKPFPSCMAITPTKIIQTAADGSVSVIDGTDNQTFASIAGTISAVFSNDTSELNKNFVVKFTDSGNGNWSLLLQPKDSTISSVLKELELKGTFDASGAVFTDIKMTENSENTILYSFNNQSYPKELNAEQKSYFATK